MFLLALISHFKWKCLKEIYLIGSCTYLLNGMAMNLNVNDRTQ